MKLLSITILLCASLLLFSSLAFVTADDQQQNQQQLPVRQITAADYATLFSGRTLDDGIEDPETPNLPWAILVHLPWNNPNSSLAFSEAATHFPPTIVRFGELIIDSPEALAIADLFNLKLPSVQVIHGQQNRFEQLKNMGGLPFGDAPYDDPKNVNGVHIAAGTAPISSTSAEIIRYISKCLPVTVFAPLDHQEMPSVLKVTSLSEVQDFMKAAQQVRSTIVAMQPLASGSGKKKNNNKKSDQLSLGREWIQLAAVSTGAQFVGRNGGMLFLLDGTILSNEDDATSIQELSISQQMMNGDCTGDGSACFDLIAVQLTKDHEDQDSSSDEGNTNKKDKATTTLIRTTSSIADIHTAVRQSTVEDSSPRAPILRSFNDISSKVTGKWSEYINFVSSRLRDARERYSRIFLPFLSNENADSIGIPRDVVRPLISTPQFQAELHQSRAGLFVIAFLRPSDRNFERHLKSVNELAAKLFQNRKVQDGKNEMRIEVFYVDTDLFPSVAEAFSAAQVPSMFVVHHLENNQHATAQYRGEFSIEKMKAMENFVREQAFDNKNLAPFRADKVDFETVLSSKKDQKKKTKFVDEAELVRHSFHIPHMDMKTELAKVLPSPASFSLVEEEAGAAAARIKKNQQQQANNKNDKNKKKETPQEEAKRLKREAAEKRQKEERKKKLEAELAAKKKAKEERMKQKKLEEEEKKKKKEAENEAKLAKIKEEVRAGKRVKKITREDIRARREAALKKVQPKKFDYRRQERLDKHLKKEQGYVGQVFTRTDDETGKVSVLDAIF